MGVQGSIRGVQGSIRGVQWEYIGVQGSIMGVQREYKGVRGEYGSLAFPPLDPNTNDAINASDNLEVGDSCNMFSSDIYDFYDSGNEFDEELPTRFSTSKREKV
jgi:hypothetical protein